MKYIFLIFLGISCLNGISQNKFTISGYIKDQSTGEEIIGAMLQVAELKKGVSSNEYGFYSLTLPEGEYTFTVSSIGYTNIKFKLNLNENIVKNIDLKSNDVELAEVEIVAEDKELTVQENQ